MKNKIKLLFIMAIAYIGTISNVSALTGGVLENNDKEQKKIKDNIIMGKNNIKFTITNDSKIIRFKESAIVVNHGHIMVNNVFY